MNLGDHMIEEHDFFNGSNNDTEKRQAVSAALPDTQHIIWEENESELDRSELLIKDDKYVDSRPTYAKN